jgi:DNA-binding MltR family transcriptional regulator
MIPLNKTQIDSIFGVEGVLSSFSAKIKIAFALGFIDADLRNQFDKIREIRNAFAHSKSAIDFNTPSIRRACVGLLKTDDPTKIVPRALYSNTAYFLMHAGTLAVSRALTKLRRSGPPKSILHYDEALAFFQKSLSRPLQQTPANPREESIMIAPQGPPRSSPA